MGVNILHERKWDEKYQQLKDYRKEHGHCKVPAAEGSLGIRVSTQRAEYRAGNDNASSRNAGRIEKLNQIGFEWDIQSEVRVVFSNVFCMSVCGYCT